MFRFRRMVLGLSMLAASLVCAETWTDPNGVELEYEEYEDGVEITYCSLPDGFSFGVEIPSKFGGLPVRRIGDWAFSGCHRLMSVTIPNGVTSIGEGAFCYCNELQSVTIPKSMTDIGDRAFEGCYDLTSVTIPSGVMEIGNSAFKDCNGLKSVTIPSGVMEIGDSAFKDCSGLKSVTIPASVTDIRYSAFMGCIGLKSLTLSKGVIRIEDHAFDGCKGIVSVTIPSSVTTMGGYAFSNCTGLQSLTIQKGVSNIGESAFEGCSGLTTVTLPASVTDIGDSAFEGCTSLKAIEIPASVTTIGDSAFGGCKGLKSVAIPASVTDIGCKAFSGCSGLTSFTVAAGNSSYKSVNGLLLSKDGIMLCSGVIVNGHVTIPNGVQFINGLAFCGSGLTSVEIPASVTDVGDYTFSRCVGLKSIEIPNGVTRVGYNTFSGCSGLKSVIIPEGVTYIMDNAFNGCSGLASVVIPKSVTYISGNAFSDCSGPLSFAVAEDNPKYMSVNRFLLSKDGRTLLKGVNGHVTIPDIVKIIGEGAFSGCSGLLSVSIPGGVTRIGDHAFEGCAGLKSVTIPEGVTGIGSYAFKGSGLTSVTIPEGVMYISDSAFSDCSDLMSVDIPDSVTSIGWGSFQNCRSLTSVTVPADVTSIGGWAFAGCRSLTSIALPDSVKYIHDYAFSDCIGLTSLKIPKSVKEIGGSMFNGCTGLVTVVISDGVTSIGSRAFEDCRSLKSVEIPESVNSIGERAFYCCRGLTSVVINANVTNIGYCVFQGCSVLTSVSLPESVTDIGDHAFSNCKSLRSIDIPNGVRCIGDHAFYECGGLTSVSLPESVTDIGDHAFSNCKSLQSIDIPNGVRRIGDHAFYECSGLTSVSLGESVESIGKLAFRGCRSLTSLLIPSSVMSIGQSSFSGCRKLTDVAIESEARISGSVFSGCSAITSFYVDEDNNQRYKSVDGLLLSNNGRTLVSGINNGHVVIPNGVTSIGPYAFSGRNGLTSVTVPASVTSIADSAFSGCSAMMSFTVAANNPNYMSVNGLLLSKDGKTLVCGVNGQVVIPNGVTHIGNNAFSGRDGLISVVVPAGVTHIGDDAFSDCSGLTSVTIPNSVTHLGDWAFYGCSALKSVTIPGSVARIGESAFYDCSGLTSVTIPNSVTHLGDWAFYGCSALKSVTIPGSVACIGDHAFYGCSGLVSVTLLKGVTRIGDGAFAECSGLNSVTIPFGVISIGYGAFQFCTGLSSIVIPDSVTRVDNFAFEGCSGLTLATVPDSVTRMGAGVFDGCNKLTQGDGGDDDPQPPAGVEKSYGPFVPGAAVSIDVPALVGYAAKGLPAGLKFDAKTGRVSGAATKGNVTVDVTFTKKGAATITTQFVVGPFPVISVAVNDMVGGKVTGSGGFLAGKKTTLRATAAKGYVFAGWYMDAAFEIPFKGEVDYRTPSLPCVMGETDITLYAKFVTLDEDSAEIEVPAVKDEYAPNSAIEPIILDLSGCISLPTVRVTGLPPGLKFTAKTLDVKATKTSPAAHYEANTVYGTPTKVGVYDTTFTVTTAGKKTATKVVTFVVVDRSKDDGVLKIVVNDATRGKTAGAGVYTTEKKVTLKATANKGFVFAGWYMDEWFEDPLWCDVDYRTPSMPYLTSGVDETVYAKFVPASEDEEIDLSVDGSMTTASAEDTVFNTSGELTLALELESASLPKVALTGLPAGLKFTAKTILDREGYVLADANTVYGTATKPGAYVVTAKLTNATVKKAIERRFTIVVDNLTAANGFLLVTDVDGVEAELRNERGEMYTVYAGVAEHGFPSIKTYYETDKVTLSGLPTGLRYDAKTGKVAGVATKAGTYTVTVTVRSGRESFVSTFTVEVVALPEWAIGTFTGAGEHYGMEGYAFFEDNLYGTVTVAANGKVSGKFLFDTDDDRLLTATFSTPSLTGYDADMEAYYCDVKVVFKDGRRVAEDQTRRLYIKPTIYDDMADTQVIGNIFVFDDEFAIDLFQNVWKLKGFWNLPSFAGRKAVTSLTLDIHGDPEIEDGTSTLTLEISPKGMVSATLVDQGLDEGKPFRERAVAKGDLLIVRREWDCYIARVALVFGNAVLIAVEMEMRVSDDGFVYYDGCEITDCTDFADWSD